ncbi:MAG: DUF72 domain-containing protein [Microcystaceae cyanobacterium]
MNFYLGCAVWSYEGWLGNFYPAKTPAKNFLKTYGDRLNCVEGNTTFYAVPAPATIQKWQQETPANFKFCLKFPQTVTHQGLLYPQLTEAEAFIERVRPLGQKLGCIFAQLPPSYSPHYFEDLRDFLITLKGQNIPLAVEVRHLDWWQSPHQSKLTHLLETLEIAQVILDTRPVYHCADDPQRFSKNKKPLVPVNFSLTTHWAIARYISHPQLALNEIYLTEWLTQVKQWLQQDKTVYFFVHCPLEDHSPFTARYFYQALQKVYPEVAPIPWDFVADSPQQLSLF